MGKENKKSQTQGYADIIKNDRKKIQFHANGPQAFTSKEEITVTVMGGLIQHIDIPKELANIVVIVKDYDTDGSEEDGLSKDDDGEFVESRWDCND